MTKKIDTNLSRDARRAAFKTTNQKSDSIMKVVLAAYFISGLLLGFFYHTWFIALASGTLCLAAYFFTKVLLPGYNAYQYVLSAVFAVFAAQFIYQMHGMFEMHFFFFVGATLLITYRNWKLFLPLLILTVVHHASFAWLQYSGMKEIYFTQLQYMDLQSFLFHAALAGVIMGICGFWAYDLELATLREASKSVMLEKQVANIQRNIAFAEDIAQGNLKSNYDLTDDGDELGKSLVKMQSNLRTSQAREEEEKFITLGITKIGDIIREHGNDPEVLADEFIRNLVKYVKLNQGGLFLHEKENENEQLRLAACYAYDRKKFMQKTFAIGDGIVGQCFMERESIYMTSVPKDYVKITSGLGESTANCIFIVPVKTNDEIAGVIELAAFRPLEEFEKKFIHRAAENMASALISSRTTHQIKTLLTDSQQRAEEMRAQEEEMRQNMEELQATQEEMSRKQSENENRIKAINESGIAAIEFSLQGIILHANEAFLKLMGYTLNEVQGKHHRIFVDSEHAKSTEYEKFWDDLANGIARPGQFERVTRNGSRVHIQGSYSILRDHSGKPVKVLKLATDITNIVKQQAA